MKSSGQLTADQLLVRRLAERPEVVPTSVTLLSQVEPALLDAADRVRLLRAIERCESMLAAMKVQAVAAVADATEALGLHPQEARHEIGAALRLSPVTAADRTRVALALRDQFPRSLAALRRGEFSWLHAANLARGTEGLSDEAARAVEDRLLPVMSRQTPAETRRAVRDAIVRIDPDASRGRARKAHEQRRIERVPDRDGRTGWYLPLPADVEAEMWCETTARAKAIKAARHAAGLDTLGLDALRVDLVVDRILARPTLDPAGDDTADQSAIADAADREAAFDTMTEPTSDPTHGTSLPELDDVDRGDGADGGFGDDAHPAVTDEDGWYRADVSDDDTGPVEEVDLDALLDLLREQAGIGAAGTSGHPLPRCSCGGAQTAAVVLDLPTALGLADNPGHLPGYGAIPADLARRLAGDRDWVRWTVEPTSGHLLDRGARRYRPGGLLEAYVSARDQVCGFAGCNRPAVACDCDHVVAFARHGQTIRINLGPLCRQHHNAKTRGRWRLHFDAATGTKTWTSPLDVTYVKNAIPLLA